MQKSKIKRGKLSIANRRSKIQNSKFKIQENCKSEIHDSGESQIENRQSEIVNSQL